MASETAPRRVYARRICRVAPDRLTGVDMRSRLGRSYAAAFIASLKEFPNAPVERVAELARLRSIASLAQQSALTGAGTTDSALKVTAAADRCARDLGGKTP